MEVNGENDDIDEDIQRLQIVLQDDEEKEEESDAEGELQSLHQDAEDEHRSFMSRSRPSTCSDVTASSYPLTSVGPEGEDRYPFLDPNNANPESCLAMNRAYQEVLLDLLRQTEMSLNENRLKQKELEEEIDTLTSGSKHSGSKSSGRSYAAVSIPYFKDKDDYPPDNADVQAKKDLQESKQHVRPQTAWTKFARKKLISAVAMDTLEKLLRPIMSRLELESEKLRQCKNQEEIDDCRARIYALQEEIETKRQIPEVELIKNVDSDKVDWMKIAVTGFECRMDAADCERTWRNVLRPEINREAWTAEEESQLQSLVEKYSMRNWKQIAKDLGTDRTPFQCLQHYQQNSQVYDNSPWTPEEDELLKEVVETCKFGKETVHFFQVAYYIDGRSATMCRKRWEEINPQKKRGRWTGHEDCLLIAAVQMFSASNWQKVAELVPTRSSGQCRERWVNVLCPEVRPKVWNYEEDRELFRLVQEHGTNWSKVVSFLPGRTDNSIMLRYRKLMMWRQNCEDFFAMPENVQKNIILGQKAIELKKSVKRNRKRKGNEGDTKPEISIKWYKKGNFKDYSDVGFLARQLGNTDEDYIKIIEDRQNNRLAAPRPLPIRKYMAKNNMATWKRKCYLQGLVEAEIKKLMDESKDNECQYKEVADRVAATLEPLAENTQTGQWNEISRAMIGRNPNELSVAELLKITRHIKKTGRAPYADTEEIEDVKVEPLLRKSKTAGRKIKDHQSSDEDDFEDLVVEQKPKKSTRPLEPQHRLKIEIGRSKHTAITRTLQKTIWTKFNRLSASRAARKRKYRLFSKKVFKSQLSSEEKEKLRRKSLLLMLKSMDVNSIQTYKRARKVFKKHSASSKLPIHEDDKTHKSTSDKNTSDNIRHSQRRKSRFSIVDTMKPHKRGAELSEATQLMLELGKELNVPEDDSDSDDGGEKMIPPKKVVKLTSQRMPDIAIQHQKENSSSGEANATEVVSTKQLEPSVKSQSDSVQMQEIAGTSQGKGNISSVQSNIESSSKPDDEKIQSQNSRVEANNSVSNTETTGKPESEKIQSQNSRVEANNYVSSTSITDPPVQPYTKKLPFIPPNHTNLHALKMLLFNQEKLCDMAANEFKVEELKRAFYEKPEANDTPFLKKLLSVLNQNKSILRKRGKRKSNNESEKNSYVKYIENVKKSREFNQLKARFCAMFTWPALISATKPPKDGDLHLSGISSLEGNDKENDGDVQFKRETVDVSDDESSESASESESEKNNLFNGNPENSQSLNDDKETKVDKRRGLRPGMSYRKTAEMVPLVYKDLEEMGDVELTEKEEMEIMVMNIITRRLGAKKEALTRAVYNRERGKTLSRLGLRDRMLELEGKGKSQEDKQEDKDEMSEAEKGEPRVKKKRKKLEPTEPRRSSRLSHHKPLEYLVPKRRKHNQTVNGTAVYEAWPLETADQTNDHDGSDTERPADDSVTQDPVIQETVTFHANEPGSLRTNTTDGSTATQVVAPPLILAAPTMPVGSFIRSSPDVTAASPADSAASSLASSSESRPIVFTLPGVSEGAVSSVAAPLMFISPAKAGNSGSTSSGLTPFSGTVPLMFTSPGISVSSASASGWPMGLFTIPVGLPMTSGTNSTLTLPILPPVLPTTGPSSTVITTGSSSTTGISSTSTESEMSISVKSYSSTPLMTSTSVQNVATSDSAGSVQLQAVLGNNVPLMDSNNTGGLSKGNSVSVSSVSERTSVNNSSDSDNTADSAVNRAEISASPVQMADIVKNAVATEIDKSETKADNSGKDNNVDKTNGEDSGVIGNADT